MLTEKCFSPSTVNEAVELLSRYGTEMKICAGGTDLFVMMRKGKTAARYLLNLSELDLSYVRKNEDNSLAIGAMMTLNHLQTQPLLNNEPFFALLKAADHVGSLQIRNMATVVGNICTGISSADVSVPLLALDAQVHAVSAKGSRFIPLSEFFIGPRQLAITPNELITELILPAPTKERYFSYFRKVGTRKELLISTLNIAGILHLDAEGIVDELRLAMGVVAPFPVRLFETEKALLGKSLTSETLDGAEAALRGEIHPRSSHHGSKEYRTLLAVNLLRRLLADANESFEGKGVNRQ